MKNSEKSHKINERIQELAPLIGLIVVVVFFQIICQGRLLTSKNIVVLTNQVFYILMIAMGAIFVYAHGNMDISIGGMFGVGMLVGTLVVNATDSILVGLLAILALCTAIGVINGILQDNFRTLPFLPSLCMMFVLRGILTFAGNIKTYKIANEYAVYDNTILKIAVLILCGAVSFYLFNYTKVGKFNKAIGGNPVAAAQLGVNLTKYKVIAFTLTGFYTGVAAFFSMVRTRSVTGSSGSGTEFNVMIALIYGGMSLSGGSKSRFSSAIYGALIFTVLGNGLTMSGFSTGMVALIKAIIFMILVYISTERTKGALPR
ncbi:MAG: ABC transporter permease [Lachnospiraceae bacterium]|nr:ABC transporter permease [Lachnospiraceae bacterium]